MKKQDVSKCALLLSLFLAASSSQLVHAEEPVSDTASSLATNVTEKLPSADMNSESSDINATTDQLDATLAPKAEAITTETSEKTSSEASQSDTMAQTPVEGQSLNLRILSTTDLHTNLVNYDYYQDMPSQKLGLAKTAVLIDEARKENSNVVLVDNGDILQGTPLGTYKAIVDPIEVGEKHPMYAALEKLGFDASTLGNHEFNYGLDYLEKAMNSTSLPIVNANVIDLATNKPLFDTYKIIPQVVKS
ncbi:metallophosphoesterase, partial [Streptococcus dysgalactiae]